MGRKWWMYGLIGLIIVIGIVRSLPRHPLSRDAGAPDYLTVDYQLANCPEITNLADLEIGGGRIAEVAVVRIGRHLLYVPIDWLRAGQAKPVGVTEQGVAAAIDGSGQAVDWRAPALPGGPYCIGAEQVVQPADQRTRRGLSLSFEAVTTANATGRVARAQGAAQSVPHLADFLYAPDWSPPDFPSDASVARPGGWALYEDLNSPTDERLYLQVGHSDRFNSRFVAVQPREHIRFTYRVSPDLVATYYLAADADPARWAWYRDKMARVLRYLETPPRRRNNASKAVF